MFSTKKKTKEEKTKIWLHIACSTVNAYQWFKWSCQCFLNQLAVYDGVHIYMYIEEYMSVCAYMRLFPARQHLFSKHIHFSCNYYIVMYSWLRTCLRFVKCVTAPRLLFTTSRLHHFAKKKTETKSKVYQKRILHILSNEVKHMKNRWVAVLEYC